MKNVTFISFCTLILFSNSSLHNKESEADSWGLNKYIFPIDTIDLTGFLYHYQKENKFISLFSPILIEPKEINFLKIVTNDRNAIYYPSGIFNRSIPHPNPSIDVFDDLGDTLSVRSSEMNKIGNFLVEEVNGKFIVGITNTYRLNGILSHDYRFDKNVKVFVIAPYVNGLSASPH